MTFAELTEIKNVLYPGWSYTRTLTAPAVTEVDDQEVIADDECVIQINLYVAEIQRSAHHFKKNRNVDKLEDLLNATDSLSAFLMDVCPTPASEPDTGPGTRVGTGGNVPGAEGSGPAIP